MAGRRSLITVIALATAFILIGGLFLLSGCGDDKEQEQAFADGYLELFATLESNPEVAQAGAEAGMAYATSGYTDLESARKAQESYEQSSANDQETLKLLDDLKAPDEDAGEIAELLDKGVRKVDEGNQKFAQDLAKAPEQTVEERAATAQDIVPAMSMYVEGVEMIIESLTKLKEYVSSNGLEGEGDVDKWLDRITSELEEIKSYIE